MSPHHHRAQPAAQGTERYALIGAPNSGKTTLFNALTGLRAKTGNYPGVTVAKFEGSATTAHGPVMIEDLPGTYALDPISPDEHVVAQVVESSGPERPDGLILTLDATTMRRSLGLVAQVLGTGLPTLVVLTFTDELAAHGGAVDIPALGRALGVDIITVTGGDRSGVSRLKTKLTEPSQWAIPVVPPPTDPAETSAWIDSVLAACSYRPGDPDRRTRRLDAVLLHPVWGSLVFFAAMFAFFQLIFTVAAPMQDGVENALAWLGERAVAGISQPFLASFVSDALFGGVGGVLVFVPQIILLFAVIAVMEASGYLARAAFLMDRIMSTAGLEGRAFVALLSSVACAIPGIMATRSLPSAKDRLATMMAAPLMTCSARLPVYTLLIAMLVPASARFGPVGLQGVIMFALYLLGAAAAMTSAWIHKRFFSGDRQLLPPFYMEIPPYRFPSLRAVLLTIWDAVRSFLRKVTTIILGTTVVLWLLLNLPAQSDEALSAAGVDTGDDAAVGAYVIDNSIAAQVGKAVQPVFEPLGFDWRVNVGVMASLSAREVFVATLGQIASATDPEEPRAELTRWVHESGPRAGDPVFDAPTVAALLVFFAFALQCMATVGVLRRESGSWRWPLLAFGYLFVVAWVGAFLARTIVGAVI